MHKALIGIVFLVVMIGLIVGIDLALLRGEEHTVLRLITNIGIVVVFGLSYYFAFARKRS